MGYVMRVVMALVIGGVCGWSLYTAAKRDNRNPLIWGIAGLFTNVIAMAAYRFSVGPIVKP